jgi:hypothetical protein
MDNSLLDQIYEETPKKQSKYMMMQSFHTLYTSSSFRNTSNSALISVIIRNGQTELVIFNTQTNSGLRHCPPNKRPMIEYERRVQGFTLENQLSFPASFE